MGSNTTAAARGARTSALLCAVALLLLLLAACGAAPTGGAASPAPAFAPTATATVSVHGVEVAASPATFDGVCSPTIIVTFTAAITIGFTAGGGAVTYAWVRSDGSTGASQIVSFPPGATARTVTDTWSLSASVGSFAGWEALAITAPGALTSTHAAFSVTCRFKAQAASISVAPASYDCTASTEPFTFTATVTLSPAAGGNVTYAWLRSDGTLSAPSTATVAPGVVSLSLTDTWQIPRPKASPWEQLSITSPNNFTSAQAIIALPC
jgi:hypothetical protein